MSRVVAVWHNPPIIVNLQILSSNFNDSLTSPLYDDVCSLDIHPLLSVARPENALDILCCIFHQPFMETCWDLMSHEVHVPSETL